MYYLSYARYLESDKLIILCSTLEYHYESVLDESLIRLKIDDELDNYNEKYEYKLMEIDVNRKH